MGLLGETRNITGVRILPISVASSSQYFILIFPCLVNLSSVILNFINRPEKEHPFMPQMIIAVICFICYSSWLWTIIITVNLSWWGFVYRSLDKHPKCDSLWRAKVIPIVAKDSIRCIPTFLIIKIFFRGSPNSLSYVSRMWIQCFLDLCSPSCTFAVPPSSSKNGRMFFS